MPKHTRTPLNCAVLGGKTHGVLRDFYADLYRTQDWHTEHEIQSFLSDLDIPTVSSQIATGRITRDQVISAIGQLKMGKAPGSDGLTAGFYQKFADHIANILVEVFNESFDKKRLLSTQKLAIIILLFKKGLHTQPNNYCLISLTNLYYKILAYILTNRLKGCLPEVIHPSQTAYMSGHFLGTNIRKIQDAIDFANSQGKDWVVLFLDFHKAFDSVSHLFLWTLMFTMGFPLDFIKWTILLYTEACSKIQNFSGISSSFMLGRGVCQGCPLLCHLFNLVGQVTIYYLQACGHFLWWTLTGDPNSLYTDDIALISESLDQVPGILRDYRNVASLLGCI